MTDQDKTFDDWASQIEDRRKSDPDTTVYRTINIPTRRTSDN